ncbi:oligosaccharide repeat unit polymerase [Buttiauxella selenatireducens]|uniref:Oligosaccharide repeat unit polymerase n=1 Tax=Buttiauxella selenatireducens TaxID=3073902 RepID=A0ABY9SEG4_9ENTR|nr:oligosaccharide repeat unit polymerase [Buttiauxella sp. R73]WMY75887.1 oligosaccharide repeat unit polymerase [Buttiauxella sp. R73]
MINLNKILLFLLTFEIIFGGGGRMFEPLGIFPVRYLLFALALALFVFNVITKLSKTTPRNLFLVSSVLFLPLYGVIVGVMVGNSLTDILFDLQPYIYTLVILFLCFNDMSIRKYALYIFLKTTKYYAIIASCVYIAYIILLRVGVINFGYVYSILSTSSEFFFRPGGAFFAKSFFFIGVGAIIFFSEKKNYLFLLCMMALFLTETRGVFLFTGVAALIVSCRINSFIKNFSLVSIAIIACVALLIIVGGRAGDSDSVRLNDFYYIVKGMTSTSLIFGEGFGSAILGRGRIEVVPLELLYKTGAIGIFLSMLPLLVVIYKGIVKSSRIEDLQVSCILIFAAGVSLTNPFLYTPMGIYIIGIAILSLEVYRPVANFNKNNLTISDNR